ncbi:hypothetical protein D9M68_728010 [compost metagenome]
MKITTYTASSKLGAMSLAYQDGHTGEPIRIVCVGRQWHLHYPAKSRALTMLRLRAARLKSWFSRARRRAEAGMQRQIMRDLRHG